MSITRANKQKNKIYQLNVTCASNQNEKFCAEIGLSNFFFFFENVRNMQHSICDLCGEKKIYRLKVLRQMSMDLNLLP